MKTHPLPPLQSTHLQSEAQDSEAIRKLEEKVFGAIQSQGGVSAGPAMAEIQSELDKVRKQSAEFNEQVGKAFEYQGKSIEENIKNLVLSELDQAKAVAAGWKMPVSLESLGAWRDNQ